MRKNLVLIQFLCLFLLLAGCDSKNNNINGPNAQSTAQTQQLTQIQTESETQSQPTSLLMTGTVTRVVDGDTIRVKVRGREETVRMIGVDTPETVKPNTPVQPYGKEASDFTKAQLSGKTIYLEKDVQERDKYGRLLAYIWLAPSPGVNDQEIRDKMFNARLLLEGYAQIMTVPPDVKYADYFTKYQSETREKGAGLWGLRNSRSSGQ